MVDPTMPFLSLYPTLRPGQASSRAVRSRPDRRPSTVSRSRLTVVPARPSVPMGLATPSRLENLRNLRLEILRSLRPELTTGRPRLRQVLLLSVVVTAAVSQAVFQSSGSSTDCQTADPTMPSPLPSLTPRLGLALSRAVK